MGALVPGDANEFIERQLNEQLLKIAGQFSSESPVDILSFTGPLFEGVDNLIRTAIERLKSESKCERLVVILTTKGGYIEPVRRMVDTMRTHYACVDFVIPDYAYSAGTVLAMSGDSIHMDYYSRLGPIDPQEEVKGGEKLVPALGYLEQYKRLIRKAKRGTITLAEIQILINVFDQAELYKYEHERELSIALLKQWLVKYKFKNWKRTETRGIAVTDAMREQRAGQIAKALNNIKRWHTHGHGISKDVLQNDLNLKIDDFGQNPDRSSSIRAYYDLLRDYMAKRSCRGVVHTKYAYGPFVM